MKQLTKQKATIGSLLPELEPTSIVIYDAWKTDKKLGQLRSNKDNDPLTEAIGVWSALVGYQINDAEIVLIQKTIKKNFKTFTIEDIKYACELSTQGRFKTQYKGTFSALYVQGCLSEYRVIRGRIMSDINAKIQAQNKLKPLPKPPNEERINNVKWIINNAYAHQKDPYKDDDYTDLGNVLYDIIKKNKLLKLTQKDIDEATAHAKKKIIGKTKAENYGAVINGGHLQKRSITDDKIVTYQKQYVVIKWLNSFKDKKELEVFTKSITIDMI